MQRSVARSLTQPLPFALAVVTVHLLLLWPLAARRNFDLSVFVYAGAHFISSDQAVPPILVFPTLGYDGQFFYRLALHPLSVARSAGGVTLDTPAKRMQRIGYPLLARAAALGRASLVPASLLAVNLVGLGVIAATAVLIARRRGLARWLPFAVVAWPGFLVTLSHDTAEIASSALMLGALACYLSARLWPYCLLAALAALTRETTVPVFLGPLAWEALVWATAPAAGRRSGRVVPCAIAFVPFAVWWLTVSLIWGQAPQSLRDNTDLGWPLVGAFIVLRDNIAGTRIWNADPAADVVTRAFVLWTTCGLIAFCSITAIRMPRLMRCPGLAGPAIGWLLVLGLMSLLSARGPWIEPLSCFRAFSECWIVGCLLLAHDPPSLLHRPVIAVIAAILAVDANVMVWRWTLTLIS